MLVQIRFLGYSLVGETVPVAKKENVMSAGSPLSYSEDPLERAFDRHLRDTFRAIGELNASPVNDKAKHVVVHKGCESPDAEPYPDPEESGEGLGY